MAPSKVIELEVIWIPPGPLVVIAPPKTVGPPASCKTEAALTLPLKVTPPLLTMVRAPSGLIAPTLPVTLIVPAVPGFRVRF